MIAKYPWHIYPDEALVETSAQKAKAVQDYGCYDASLAMVTRAALMNRDPALPVLSGSRTEEYLALDNNGDYGFTLLQKEQLFTPVSNYDGGGVNHNFTTRHNAYSFPEIVADLSAPARAACNPRLYESCESFQGSAGASSMMAISAVNAASATNDLLTDGLWNGWYAVVGLFWGQYADFSHFHKVALAGFDRTDAQYPLLINDPAPGTLRHARIGFKASGDKTAKAFPDPSSAGWPYIEFEDSPTLSGQYNYIQMFNRVQVASTWRRPMPTAPQCSVTASCTGTLTWSCTLGAGDALTYAVKTPSGLFPSDAPTVSYREGAGPFPNTGTLVVRFCGTNSSWSEKACIAQSVPVKACTSPGGPPVFCSFVNPAPGCVPPPPPGRSM